MIELRVYGPLNDFLPPERRQASNRLPLPLPTTVKDLVESQGVPHPEVALLIVNGQPVGFSHLLQDGDRIAVYPETAALPLEGAPELRPPLAPPARFVLDVHLGRLAGYLRLLGIDTWYRNEAGDATLARISHDERRILLTRDIGLLKRNEVDYGYSVRSTEPRRQAEEVLERYGTLVRLDPFRRCLTCNGILDPVDKERIQDRLPPRTRELFDEFRACRDCGQVYWKGSHYRRMLDWVADVRRILL